MKRSRGGMIGAILGFLLFLAVGALHTLAFSATMGNLLAGVVFGSQEAGNTGLGPRLFIAGSITVGIVAVLSLFMVVGSVAGAFVGAIASHVKFGRKSDDEPMFVIEKNGD